MKNIPLPGCHLRPVMFEPTSNKWSGQACAGFQIHVADRGAFMPYRTSLALLQAVMTLYKDDFRYKEPPYEYECEKLPLDLILGASSLRLALESGADLLELENSWQAELVEYDQQRRKYFLYEQV